MLLNFSKEHEEPMNTQERWSEITRLQCEIDNELRSNPASAFWQRANALLQLLKYNALVIEHAEQTRRQSLRQE
jgi:hypothetical protein